MRIIGREQRAEPVAGIELKLAAHSLRVLIIIAVAVIAVMLGILAGKAERGVLAERHVDGGRALQRVVIAVFGVGVSAQLAQSRLRGNHVDRTAGSVAAIERHLWTLA